MNRFLPLSLALATPAALAQTDITILESPPEAYLHELGAAANIDGDVVAVGTPHDHQNGFESGSFQIFEKVGGVWGHTLVAYADDLTENDHLCNHVAIDGERILAGCRLNDAQGTFSGAAYLFEKQGGSWVQSVKFAGSDVVSTDNFGGAVAIEGDRLVITSPTHDAGGVYNTGALYVFEKSGGQWTETAKLVPSDPTEVGTFAAWVVLEGDTIFSGAIGAWRVDQADGVRTGAVYVHEHDGANWVETQKIVASDAEHLDRFGSTISYDDGVLMVTSPRDDDGAPDAGSAYVFEHDGSQWVEKQKLQASDPMPSDEFGVAITVHGDIALVGAPRVDEAIYEGGAIYTFQRFGDEWHETSKFFAPNVTLDDNFGFLTYATPTDFLVTAARHDDPGTAVGDAYIVPRDQFPTSYCEGAPNSVGDGAWIGVEGGWSVAENELALIAGGAPAGQFGLFFYGPEQLNEPFGEGFRCVGPGGVGTSRLEPSMTIEGDGTLTRPLDLDAPPASSGAGEITPGSTWNFQLWYRDPAGGGTGFNLSNAISVLFTI